MSSPTRSWHASKNWVIFLLFSRVWYFLLGFITIWFNNSSWLLEIWVWHTSRSFLRFPVHFNPIMCMLLGWKNVIIEMYVKEKSNRTFWAMKGSYCLLCEKVGWTFVVHFLEKRWGKQVKEWLNFILPKDKFSTLC